MKLGIIGDDFTGSSDIALMLAGAKGSGLRTVQYVGVPTKDAPADVEAGIVSLKSRSIPAAEAVAQSLAALAWLRQQGCQQILFKICSTFDSTPQGNIGPVTEALIEALGTSDPVIVCPAFPATGRSVYQGHLFVHDRLLSQSGLENHPLNPMTDPDLRRWLAGQTKGAVGHVGVATISQGADAGREALICERDAGRQLIICDAIKDADLHTLGAAFQGFALAVCGSGLAVGLPGLMGSCGAGAVWQGVAGPVVVLSGSCSIATRAQIKSHRDAGYSVRSIAADDVLNGSINVEELADWALRDGGIPLLYTSEDPEVVAEVQNTFGRERSALAIEMLFADLSSAVVKRGARRIISAGGETSGAIVSALKVNALEIGPMIDPGVPALLSGSLALALKSGNFGGPDFFAKAADILGGAS